MLAIRLTRMGAKGQPSYRIIVTRKRYKRDGKFIERLGHYNPLTEPATIVVDKQRFDYWVTQGAQPTDVIKRIVMGVKGTKKRAPKKAQPEATAPAPAKAAPVPETPNVAAVGPEQLETAAEEAQTEQPTAEKVADASEEPTEPNVDE